ncbi:MULTISPECIES: pyridoxal-dependent decarboxylase, pyridoxal binding domain protein [unclassified Microcystis]|uniref:diaminopimelate decarboxylase family protein n=1 Tax=unclassified Microcystis TaxID=2643300 RepID=UPI0022C9800D|nr:MULTISPECIES: pyridoxal-dependent decarboxylase, pyridoxal binding domain protein [unclassified Microcystis]MCZ8247632.1 pyridoxal-dependent decarboxylase, pyridoxal binding domain protein [Microcystis sp. LE19-195.1E]
MEEIMETWTRSIDIEEIAKRHGSPLYILNLGQLRRNLSHFVDLVGSPSQVAYPIKANPSMAILNELASLGCSADCSSKYEVELALSCGFPLNRIIYNSPAPDRQLMAALLDGGSTVVADSQAILDDLQHKLYGKDWSGSLLVRVNPEKPVEYFHNTDWQDLVSHASPNSKFGIPSEELPDALASCQLPIAGLHIHIGTQMDNVSAFSHSIQFIHHLKNLIEAGSNHCMRKLNLGGGLGIDFHDGQQFPTIPEYTEALKKHLLPGIEYIVEPGHALVGNAVALLTRIRELKQMRGRRWAIVDVGSDQLIKVTLLSWSHQIIDRNHRTLPTQGDDAIGGPLCFAGDILLPSTNLEGQSPGDPLLIQHAGAYCYSVSNHFNGFHGPGHITIDEMGQIETAYTAEDVFADHNFLGFSLPTRLPSEVPDHEIDLDIIERLSSDYLKQGASSDGYTFTRVQLIAPRTLQFMVKAKSSLGAISIPFAARIASDATIISALYLVGKQAKDVSVWGTRIYMKSDTIIRTSQPLRLVVYIAPKSSLPVDKHITHLSHWDLGNGKFKGSFRFTL